MMLTEHIFDILVGDLNSPISVVHLCTDSCTSALDIIHLVSLREKTLMQTELFTSTTGPIICIALKYLLYE